MRLQAQTPVIIGDDVFDNDDGGDSVRARIMANAKVWQFPEK